MKRTVSTATDRGRESRKLQLCPIDIIGSMKFSKGKPHRALLVGLVCFLGLCATTAPAFGGGMSEEVQVLLDQGAVRHYFWAVGLSRDSGQKGDSRPCVLVQVVDTRPVDGPRGVATEKNLTACGSLPVAGPPNIVSMSTGSGSRELTVFGMVFTPRVSVAYLDFGSDGVQRVKLKKLNGTQMRNADVRPLRYAAFVRTGVFCLRQITGYGAAGDEIFRSRPEKCPEGDVSL